MNLRQLFTNTSLWGKLIGAFFGFLMAGPAGAVLGIILGNIFDRGLNEHFNNPHWYFYIEKQQEIKKIFVEVTFSIMGYLAKVDGRISEQEILLAEDIMDEMKLTHEQKQSAQHFFYEGKKTHFNVTEALSEIANIAQSHPNLLKLFIEIQYRAVQVDGLTYQKINALNAIFSQLGIAPIQKQDRFYQYSSYNDSSNHRYTHQQRSSQSPYHHALDHEYKLLGVTENSSKQDTKKAYQRLISRHHPDKLIAKGLPDDAIKIANEKTQKIRKAYEAICASRGW